MIDLLSAVDHLLSRGLRPVLLHAAPGGVCTCGRETCKKSAGKHPVRNAWQNHDWADCDQAEAAQHPRNLGLRMGGPERTIAIDLDGPEGQESWQALQITHGPWAPTLTQTTGSGGTHYLYRVPDGHPMPSNAVRIRPGIDIRSEGGQIVVSPSGHRSGRRYEWQDPTAPIAELTPEQAALVCRVRTENRPAQPLPPYHPPPEQGGESKRALVALQRESSEIAGLKTGRHNAIYVAAMKMGHLVAAGEITEGFVVDSLLDAAQSCGEIQDYGEADVRRCIRDGLTVGKRDLPRVPLHKDVPKPTNGKAHHHPDYDQVEEEERAAIQGETHQEPPPMPGDDEKKPRRFTTTSDVIARWRNEGPIVRVSSGLPTLDVLCGGGLPIPRRILIVGAPGAAKTYLETTLARRFVTELSTHGFVVGIHAVDEDDSDLTVRFAQMAGFLQAQIEERSPELLDSVEAQLRDLPIRFYGYDCTIEEVALEVATWAKSTGKFGCMCTESLHTVTSARADGALTERQRIEANIKALRWAYDAHHLTTIVTAEMNRAGYSSGKSASDANPLASAAEARACEYWAQTLIALNTVKDQPNMVRAQLPKNRGFRRGELWLELDHPTHGLREVEDPDGSPEAHQQAEERRQASNRAAIAVDAKVLANVAMSHPGANDEVLETEVSKAGHRWGRRRFALTKSALVDGINGVRLVDRSVYDPKARRPRQWFVVPVEESNQ